MTIAKRADASFDPGVGGKGVVHAPLVIDGTFDLASGALYVGSVIENRGYLHIVNSNPAGLPAGMLDLRGRPLPETNSGTDVNPGQAPGAPGTPPAAGP